MAQRAILAVAFIVLLSAGTAAAQGWTGYVQPPPIPGSGDLDWMAFMPRTWTFDELPNAHRVDALGLPENDTWPEIAYRIHGSIASAEGVLVAPTPNTTAGLDARYNTGYRFHAITFDPPLPLTSGGTLHRIFPGPLDWSNLTLGTDDADAHMVQGDATVPAPNANGTSPPAEPNDSDGNGVARIDVDWRLGDAIGTSDAFLVRSPAHLGIRIGLTLIGGSVADWQDLETTNITFTFHFDFGAATRGWSATDQQGIGGGGIYLNRTRTYATLRFAENVTTDNGTVPASFTYSAPAGKAVPTPEETRLSTPVSLNLTTRFPPPSSCPPDTACAPRIGRDLWIEGELGFLSPTSARPPTPTPTPTGSPGNGNDIPAAGLPFNLTALALLAVLRRLATHK